MALISPVFFLDNPEVLRVVNVFFFLPLKGILFQLQDVRPSVDGSGQNISAEQGKLRVDSQLVEYSLFLPGRN